MTVFRFYDHWGLLWDYASKETYYEALRTSTEGWIDGANDPKPFVRYFLGLMLKCYRMFEERVSDVISAKMSKPERIKSAIDRQIGRFTKAQLHEICPDVSETTVERALKQFLDEGFIRRIGAGRGATSACVDCSDDRE